MSASEDGKMLNESDRKLNMVYQKLLASINNPEQRTLLVQSEETWIKFRDDNIAFFYARYPASKGGLFLKTAMNKERTAFLESLLATPPSKDLMGPVPTNL